MTDCVLSEAVRASALSAAPPYLHEFSLGGGRAGCVLKEREGEASY